MVLQWRRVEDGDGWEAKCACGLTLTSAELTLSMGTFERAHFTSAEHLAKIPPSRALHLVPTRQLRAWLRKARTHCWNGEFTPAGWGRSFTIDNLTAELSLRPDKDVPTNKRSMKKVRQERAKGRRP